MSINKDILTPPTFLSYSLGCRTNQAEIETISQQFSDHGFSPYTPPCTLTPLHLCTYPTLILLNTCVVTQKAEKETRQKINELRRKYPKSFFVVFGCAATAKQKFNLSFPESDLLITNEQKNRTVEIIEQKLCSSSAIKVIFDSKYTLSGRKFIKIQDGCNKLCSFCITCLIRGKPTSIPSQEIIKEINFWVDKGIKEIILTGINLGLYGESKHSCHSDENRNLHNNHIDSRSRPSGLSGMTTIIKKVLKETKIERLSFSSIYPEMLTYDFLKITIGNPRITQCFHLSLQSGSPSVLERMNRKTNLNELLKKLIIIKKRNPYFAFRADIITGFPDETEKEFEETINFIKKAKISFVHSFPFSVRQDTKVEGLIKSGKYHEIENSVKRQRVEMLKKVVEEVRNNEAKKMIDSRRIGGFHCLIVRDNEGITENGWNIKIKNQNAKIKNIKGKILPVKIIDFKNDYLLGEILSLPT